MNWPLDLYFSSFRTIPHRLEFSHYITVTPPPNFSFFTRRKTATQTNQSGLRSYFTFTTKNSSFTSNVHIHILNHGYACAICHLRDFIQMILTRLSCHLLFKDTHSQSLHDLFTPSRNETSSSRSSPPSTAHCESSEWKSKHTIAQPHTLAWWASFAIILISWSMVASLFAHSTKRFTM